MRARLAGSDACTCLQWTSIVTLLAVSPIPTAVQGLALFLGQHVVWPLYLVVLASHSVISSGFGPCEKKPASFHSSSASGGPTSVLSSPLFRPAQDVCLYDPFTNTWERRTSMLEAREAFAAAVLGSEVIVAGEGAPLGSVPPKDLPMFQTRASRRLKRPCNRLQLFTYPIAGGRVLPQFIGPWAV